MTAFKVLLASASLPAAMLDSLRAGSRAGFLELMLADSLYTTFDVPSDIKSAAEIVHTYGKAPFPSGYSERAIAIGDVIVGSDGSAVVYAGPGDFNDVSGKISAMEFFPGSTSDSALNDSEDEDQPDEDEDEAPAPVLVKSSLAVGAIAKPRTVERAEMQPMIQAALANLFAEQNIPMTRDHTRRAVRSLLRLGVLMMKDLDKDVGSMMNKFVQCMREELGSDESKKTITVVTY